MLVTDALTYAENLREFCDDADTLHANLKKQLDADELACLNAIMDADEQTLHTFGAVYLRCAEDAKGEHAFALEKIVRAPPDDVPPLQCPSYVREAIEWATRKESTNSSRAAVQ